MPPASAAAICGLLVLVLGIVCALTIAARRRELHLGPGDQPYISGGKRFGTRHADGSITFLPGCEVSRIASAGDKTAHTQPEQSEPGDITEDAEHAR